MDNLSECQNAERALDNYNINCKKTKDLCKHQFDCCISGKYELSSRAENCRKNPKNTIRDLQTFFQKIIKIIFNK